MTEPEEIDEDLFADLYDGDEGAIQSHALPKAEEHSETPDQFVPTNAEVEAEQALMDVHEDPSSVVIEQNHINEPPAEIDHSWQNTESTPTSMPIDGPGEGDSHGIGIKEDGKMFIGGLNWETTDQSLKDYFSQFGEVQECTVMRDGASGRSRGFGFLTFKDPKTVNIVMVKEHFLDGKIIDPKRAIPRDEQERTSKIFVGGVSQEATEQDFKEYFMQYGRVVDATLMMDKDTGRPRGFGFVTFDSEAAVDATLQGDLMILGKPIEVKKAQPRGNMREEEERDRRGRRGGRDFRDDHQNNANQNQAQGGQGFSNNMTPQMMAQYWQKMQQLMAMAAAVQSGQMANPMAMAAMNPALMQQIKMTQMQAMQQQMQQSRQQDSQSPNPQNQGAQNMQGLTPQMVQQMQMQMQLQPNQGQSQNQGQSPGSGGFGNQMSGVPTGPSMNSGGRRSAPGYNAQEQLVFEQQKYEQQQRRVEMQQYQPGGPTSWEGMYDDVPQPNMGPQGGSGKGSFSRGGGHKSQTPKATNAPANAPTGPKNAGVPGANYRGGGRGSGHRGGYHPYRR